MRLSITVVVLLLLTMSHASAQAFNFLFLRPGIKSNAMGGAQTAIADDYLAFYYNPAGLSRIQTAAVGYSRIQYQFFDIVTNRLSFAGAAVNLRKVVVGFAAYYFDSPNLFYKQRSYQMAIARKLSDHVRVGASFKYLKTVGGVTSAVTGDVGLQIENILKSSTLQLSFPTHLMRGQRFARAGFQGLAFGLSLLNTGPQKAGPDALPQMLNIGGGYHAIESDLISLITTVELNKILTRRRGDKDDGFLKAWFTSWGQDGWDSFHSGVDINLYHLLSLYFGYEHYFNILNETKGGTTLGLALGPEYARLEVFYRVYPIFLPDNPSRIWRFGFSVSY